MVSVTDSFFNFLCCILEMTTFSCPTKVGVSAHLLVFPMKLGCAMLNIVRTTQFFLYTNTKSVVHEICR